MTSRLLRTSSAPPRIRLATAVLPLAIGAVVLSGCAGGSWPGDSGATAPESPATAAASPTADAPKETPTQAPQPEAPRAQEETCDWDRPALAGAETSTPSGQSGELDEVIIGAWQHTHFDSGAGFEAPSPDIRYVFSSPDRILYCQHLPGVTEFAENAADITWDGTTIVLPGGRAGFTVIEWDADTMVWINETDGSRYLLQRR